MPDGLKLTTFAVTTSHWMDPYGMRRAELIGGPEGEWVHYVWQGGMWVATGLRTPNPRPSQLVVVCSALGQSASDKDSRCLSPSS